MIVLTIMISLNSNKIIAVSASSLKSGGGLTILRQFISHINDKNTYYIFIDKNLKIDDLGLKNIHIVKVDTSGIVKRIIWDWYGLNKWFKSRDLKPDVVISMQNTSVVSNKESKKIIYLHQGISLHSKSWSFFKRKERTLAFYKYIYPLFIFIFANKKTKFVVQTQWMKTALCTKFNQDAKNIFVFKPDLTQIDIEKIKPINLPYTHNFFYPATSFVFKNHKEIIYALNEIKKSGGDISSVGIYLTINENEDQELVDLILQFKLQNNIQFLGPLSYEEVLSYYKACTSVLFPSSIESFGLPLIEAAMLGKPIIVLDTEYSREVISGYAGASFVMHNSPQLWKNAILSSISNKKQYDSYQPNFEYNWDSFFRMINE